jgi:DNA polymerase delta subunit 2
MYMYLNTESRLDIARQTLKAMHLAPTCPDTLWCHSLEDTDPFVIKELPHLYFIGNQPEFATDVYESEYGRSCIVLVPKFSTTGSVVLVHSATLEVRVLNCGHSVRTE